MNLSHRHRAEGGGRALGGPAAFALALALALIAAAPVGARRAAAQQAGFSVTVTPTKVADGQAVSITIKSAPGFEVLNVHARQCRAGVTYQPSTGVAPAPDFSPDGGHCPFLQLSSSAYSVRNWGPTLLARASEPDGQTFLFNVGAGVVTWRPLGGPDDPETTLECGPGHPCALVVEVQVREGTGPSTWQPVATELTFDDANPLAACGGLATGSLATGGSDRMTETWIGWTVAECKLPGRSGAAGNLQFVGEGPAVQSFAEGRLDLAYTAGGYHEAMGLAPPDTSLPGGGRRAAVAVPIALNAAVLAVGNGRLDAGGQKVPFRDVRLTVDEVASIMNEGTGSAFDKHGPAMVERNPELGAGGGLVSPAAKILESDTGAGGAASGPEASSWYLTRWLTDAASPASWTVPDNVRFGVDRGKLRGVDASLAIADPSYVRSLSLLTGRSALVRALSGPGGADTGGIWIFTDLATARALGLTPVQIQGTQGGPFVAPTPETLAAAVPAMVKDPDGVLISNPRATAPEGQPQPYPLPMVEYALVPAEPLLDIDCVRRTPTQTLLQGWLTYVTGAGQAALPPGVVALPPTLLADAQAALPRVGTAPVTGTCEGTTDTTVASTTTSTVPVASPPTTAAATTEQADVEADGGGIGSAGRSSSAGGGGPVGSGSGSGAGAGDDTVSAGPSAARPASVSEAILPGYAGQAPSGLGGTVLSLVGLMVVSSLSAVRTRSGGPAGGPPAGSAPEGYRVPPADVE